MTCPQACDNKYVRYFCEITIRALSFFVFAAKAASLAQDDTQRAFRAVPSLPSLPGGKDLAKMAYF